MEWEFPMPAFERSRQEDLEFRASLSSFAGPEQELGILTYVARGWYLKEKLQSHTVSVQFHHPQPLPFALSL